MAKTNYGLVAALTVAATLGGLLFGYDTAVISGATEAITRNFVTPRHLTEGAANILSGVTIGSALPGCVIGTALAGKISNRLGRRAGLIISGILFFVSSLGAGYPEFIWGVIGADGHRALPFFVIYRVMGGVAIGMASMLSPLYIAEVAPAAKRGMLVTFYQIAIAVGMALVYFVNWGIQHGRGRAFVLETGWRYMLACAAIPAVLLIVCMLAVPETPRFLVLKGRNSEARALLERLGGAEDAESTLKEIESTLVERTRPLLGFGSLVLVVGIMLSVFQQVVGINAILYFAPQMFQNMGASLDQALLHTGFVGVAMMVFTLIATGTVDRLGRKPLLIVGAFVMAAAMLALGTLFAMHVVSPTTDSASTGATASSYLALAIVVLYIAGFSCSWGPVTWVMLSEIFPNSIKSKAMPIGVEAQWLTNFFVTSTFTMMDGSSYLNAKFNHGFAYWLYAVGAVGAALFVMRFVPETKGRTLEAIEELWHRAPSEAPPEPSAEPVAN